MTKTLKMPRIRVLLAGCLAGVALFATVSAASAKTYRPTRTDDPRPNGCRPNNCSLREAVIATAGFRGTIVLQPGRRYRLTRRGNGKDSPATGDLDFPLSAAYVTVETAKGRSPATIDADGIDRIFDSIGVSQLTLNRVVLRGGRARRTTQTDPSGGNGGAIYGAGIHVLNSRLVKNATDGDGGAVYSQGGALEVRKSQLKKNSAKGDGGALFMDAQAFREVAEVTRTRATHNRAGGAGGMAAMTNEAGISLSRSYVADNRATGVGGAIYSQQGNDESLDVVIDRSTITGNESRASGGGLATSYTEVANSTISANRAANDGGGIVARIPAKTGGARSFQVENSTIANNKAGGSGGGVSADSGFASARLVATTVVRNTASQGGGGLYQGAGDTLTAQNTIVALNRAGATNERSSDCFTASTGISSQGHNLIGDPSGCGGFTAVGDLIGGPLKLGKLAKNGGPTKTVALMKGSRAIGGADPSALPSEVVRFDQRGFRRDKTPDIGAYERVVKKKK